MHPPWRGAATHAALLAFFAVAAIAMTWPLAPNLPHAIAHPGDPFINSWILDWELYATTHEPAEIVHGNIFHPLRYTLAFSENMLGIAIVLAPLFLAGAPILVIYNIAVLAGFALAGYGAALLGRHITGSLAAGIAAGIFFAFLPWRFTHLTHLQHLWTLWLPLLVLALLRLRERPTALNATLFGAAFVINGLTNLHWLAFGSTAIVAAAVLTIPFVDPALRRRFIGSAAIAIVISGLLLVPLLIPYWHAGRIYNLRGDIGETLHYSGSVRGWGVASLHNRLYGPLLNDGSVEPEQWAFPGILGPLLALTGLAVGATRLRRRGGADALPLTLALLFIILGFLASLGLHFFLGRFLFETIPLFRGIRVPARWAMIVYLGIAMLVAIGVAALARRRPYVIATMIAALLLLELRAAPIRWYLTTGETPAVYPWLAEQPFNGAVLELPMQQAHVYEYLLHATRHHKPLLNGVSGWKPPHYAELEELSLREPIPPEFLDRLRALGTSLIIVHRDKLGARAAATDAWLRDQRERGELRLVGRFPRGTTYDEVYALRGRATAVAIDPRVVANATRGALTHPLHWELITGPLEVTGWIETPHPVRDITLWFDNRRTRATAEVVKNGNRAEFRARFATRRDTIRADTDLQVELTDATGRTHRLPQVWLRWRRKGETLREHPPQTAELGPYIEHPQHVDTDPIRPTAP